VSRLRRPLDLPQSHYRGTTDVVPLAARAQSAVMWPTSTLCSYFAVKAATVSLAVTYVGELARWGIDTSIVVPGGKGTNHCEQSSSNGADAARATVCEL